jgi:hypothetical protein
LTTAFVVLGAALTLAGNALGEPRIAADHADLQRRLAELQRKEHDLQSQIRRIEAELAREASARAAAQCALPFYMDSMGIKHLRPECVELAGQPSCEPPYTLDEQGVRRFRPACASGAAVRSDRADE